MNLAEFCSRWLAAYAPTVRASSLVAHRGRIVNHVLPALGTLPLDALTPLHLQTRYAELLATGLSPCTVVGVHHTLALALRAAVKWRFLPSNPADDADPPRCERYEARTLTPPQVRSLLAAAKGTRLEAAWFLFVACGLRRGELLALRWSDLDLDAGLLSVCRTLTRGADARWTVGPVKTAKGRRTIALDPELVSVLRDHHRRQQSERRRWGVAYADADLVFCRRNGPVLNPDALDTTFRRLLARAGLPAVRLHDLRHTCATLMMGSGEHPKVVSELLGHSNIGITLDLYSHVDLTMQRNAVARLTHLIGG